MGAFTAQNLPPQRYKDLGKIYIRLIDNRRFHISFREIASMKAWAKDHHDNDLELESDSVESLLPHHLA